MGQQVGKAAIVGPAQPFVNLPRVACQRLWESFHDVAEGFGLQLDELQEICYVLDRIMATEKDALDILVERLFQLLDTDENGLIDALEAQVTLAAVSSMSIEEKAEFMFNCFDFDESGRISLDETCLLFRQALSGCAKCSGSMPPHEEAVGNIAAEIFRKCRMDPGGPGVPRGDPASRAEGSAPFKPTTAMTDLSADPNSYISKPEFIAFCASSPEVATWMAHYDDLPDFFAEPIAETAVHFGDHTGEEGATPLQSVAVSASTDPEYGTMGLASALPGGAAAQGEGATLPDGGGTEGAKNSADGSGQGSFVAVKPWLHTIESTVPSKPPPIDTSIPDSRLTLDWVYGYNSTHQRNNVLYSAGGEIIYPAGGVTVIYDKVERTQRFHIGHSDEVTAIAMHPNGRIVATGERGRVPKIIVWDVATCSTICTIRGFHEQGISQLAFSTTGDVLITVGMDVHNSVALYDWSTGSDTLSFVSSKSSQSSDGTPPRAAPRCKLIASQRSGREKVLCCAAPPLLPVEERGTQGESNQNKKTFVTGGEGGVMLFWDFTASQLQFKRGVYGKTGATVTMLSLGFRPDGHVVTGSADGRLYVWQGRTLSRVIHATPSSAILSLYSTPPGASSKMGQRKRGGGIVSGSADGRIRVWDSGDNMRPGALFSTADLGSYRPSVSSLCWDVARDLLLIGTRGAEVYEINSSDGSDQHGGPLAQGHCEYELWGISVHPSKAQVCTVGDDKTVRVWDTATKSLLKMTRLDTAARTCAYAPDGMTIAVGLGAPADDATGPGRSKKDGALVVLNEEDLTVIFETRDTKKWIRHCRFSPDNNVLALASGDSSIYLYNVEDFTSIGRCRGCSGPVTRIDFSSDSQWIHANSAESELCFFDANTGKQQKSVIAMKDVDWDTWSLTLGWSVQGLWPAIPDGTNVVACDRSKSGAVIASADTFGRIRMTRYPCVMQSGSYLEYRGHSAARIADLRFSNDDSMLFSIGGRDRCLMQWRHGVATDEETAETVNVEPDEEDREDFKDGGSAYSRTEYMHKANEGNRETYFQYLEDIAAGGTGEAVGVGGSSGGEAPVKRWTGRLVAPSAIPPLDARIPESQLELDWIYGYRAHDCRSNIFYAAESRRILFHAAKVAVCYDKETHLQSFMTEHTDEIVSMAVHPTGEYAATGQVGKKPCVLVWRTDGDIGMPVVSRLAGLHRRAVIALAFTRHSDGAFLATAGMDPDHTIAVYEWRSGSLVVQTKAEPRKILALDYSPDGSTLVQVGVDHVQFWHREGRNMAMRRGIVGKKGRVQPLTCIGWAGPFAVIGTQDGHLYRFEGHMLRGSLKAHDRTVTSLYTCTDGLVSGGRDCCVKIWSPGLECRHEFDLRKIVGGAGLQPSSVRAVCWDSFGNTLLVGFRNSSIYELSSINGTDLHGGALLEGHAPVGELWGLAMHPSEDTCITVGDDKTLRVWDLAHHRMERVVRIDTPARACAYHPDGNSICIGLGGRIAGKGRNKKDGVFMIMSVPGDYEIVHEGRDTREWITDAKFSSDGDTLALGSRDNNIYLYDVSNGYAARAVFSKHTSFVTHLDFSSDSQWIMSNSGADDLLWCDAATGAHLASGARVRDQTWETWTCPQGWHAQGIWRPHEAPALQISAVDRTSGGGAMADMMERAGAAGSDTLMVVGDAYGRIRLYRFPCTSAEQPYLEFSAHSPGPIPSLRFSWDDRFVMSVGAQDRTLIQWRHQRDKMMDDADGAGDSGDDSDLLQEGEPGVLPEGAEAYLNSRPWAGAISAPSAAPRPDNRRPLERIEVEWVYGFRAQNARNNVRYNLRGEVVFHAAGLGVVYDKARDVQRFHAGYHAGDVLCLALDPTRRFCATGEEGDRPGINVWDTQTTRLLGRLGGGNGEGSVAGVAGPHCGGGVVAVAFSHDGTRLASVSCDANHTIAVWRSQRGDWTDGQLVAWRAGARAKVLYVHFTGHPKYFLMTGGLPSGEGTGGGDDGSGGGGSVRFWSTRPGDERVLCAHKPRFGLKGKVQPLLCAATSGYRIGEAMRVRTDGEAAVGSLSGQLYNQKKKQRTKGGKRNRMSAADKLVENPRGVLVTGTVSGHIYMWNGLEMVRPVKAHTRSVTCLHAAHGGWSSATLVSGSKDGTVKLWDARLIMLRCFDMSEARPAARVLSVRSVCYDPHRELVLVGMRGSEIYEFTRETKACRQILQGHTGDADCELWGLAPHPDDPNVVATTGDDETIRVWDIAAHRLLRTADLGGPCRAVCWSSDGSMLALGIGAGHNGGKANRKSQRNGNSQKQGKVADGVMLVLKADTLDIIHEARDSMEWISDIKFDARTAWCAAASMDGVIYVYDVAKKFQLTTRCAPSVSYISHFDFSDDGARIQASTGNQELLFYDTATGDLIQTPSAMKNVDWHTWTTPIGWPVQGLWPEPSDALPVALLTAVHRSNNFALMAAADEFGGVRVVRYPCLDPRAAFANLAAHSMHATNVRFNADDTYLFTVGGTDRAFIQWRLAGDRTNRLLMAGLSMED